MAAARAKTVGGGNVEREHDGTPEASGDRGRDEDEVEGENAWGFITHQKGAPATRQHDVDDREEDEQSQYTIINGKSSPKPRSSPSRTFKQDEGEVAAHREALVRAGAFAGPDSPLPALDPDGHNTRVTRQADAMAPPELRDAVRKSLTTPSGGSPTYERGEDGKVRTAAASVTIRPAKLPSSRR